ncbi:MAG: sulfatase [Candidatus Latescibacterota bacterium]|nr:MAG: sulfatase [Candidatus Latescibacterota bacterium]
MRFWKALIPAVLLFSYAFAALEWLFFVTKPSFMSPLTLPVKLAIPWLAPLPFAGLALGFVAIVGLFAVSGRDPRYWRACLRVAALAPATLLAALLVLMLDNFTNTILGFGIHKTEGVLRWVYAGVFLLALVVGYSIAWRAIRFLAEERGTMLRRVALLLPAVSLLLLGTSAVVTQSSASKQLQGRFPAVVPPREQPNVLLISGDGINARHLSAYGYARATSPFMQTLAEKSLLCENAYANCAHTCGSLTSMLTGRLPTETRVTYPPDILTGEDSYRHLPGLMKRLGYRTVSISVRHYADPFDLNMRDAFDRSTFQNRDEAQASPWLAAILGDATNFFVEQVTARVRDRVLHVFASTPMPAAFVEVQGAPSDLRRGRNRGGDPSLRRHYPDEIRIRSLLQFIDASEGPFFAQVHLMGTHGARFDPEVQRFSRGKVQTQEWGLDFYDDAIVQFDQLLAKVIRHLGESGKLEQTIVVVSSDHGMAFEHRERTPLLFRFPHGAHAGRVRSNAQNLDVAPTILDYLGVPAPAWMSGRSLLEIAARERLRPVFSTKCKTGEIHRDPGRARVAEPAMTPPFYSIGRVTMIVCNRSYTLDVVAMQLEVEEVAGHTAPCEPAELPSAAEAQAAIRQHLADRGYDVSGIPESVALAPAGAVGQSR